MTEKKVLPWVDFNQYMDDDYREIVVKLALSHLAHTSPDIM